MSWLIAVLPWRPQTGVHTHHRKVDERMVMLAELTTVVIGVDPDKPRIHLAAVDSRTKGELGHECFPNNPDGHDEAMAWADSFAAPEDRAWAIEGAGSFGSRPTRSLQGSGEWVIEFSFPSGPAAPDGAKTDHLDAARAALEVLGRTKLAKPRPGPDGAHRSLRMTLAARQSLVRQRTALINTLKAIMMAGPETLITDLDGLTWQTLVKRCTKLRPTTNPSPTDELAAAKLSLRSLARSISEMNTAVIALTQAIDAHVTAVAPQLIAQNGVGPINAAQILVTWGHRGRIHSADAWGRISGTAPIPATSGREQQRHRLSRGGDRALNSALHNIAIIRARNDDETKAYIARKTAQGKTTRDARRSLKRYIGRRIFRLLENPPEAA